MAVFQPSHARLASTSKDWPSGQPPVIVPEVDQLGRWLWPENTESTARLLTVTGHRRKMLQAWVEDLIYAVVPPSDVEAPDQERLDRLQRFQQASFNLQVEEHFSRTKCERDRIIYSMIRCRNQAKLAELALAIREGEIEFAAAAIRHSEGPESAQGGRVGPVWPQAGHPELNRRLAEAKEGDLIGPFAVGDVHVLLRLDTRLITRLDEALQGQLIQELYNAWLNQQLTALEAGQSIEPIEYLPLS